MAASATPIETHDVHSDRLMRHAFEELKKGDRIQASEKAWGAMAHTLKAIADERGLKYETHRDAYKLVKRVTDSSRFKDAILGGFTAASDLHRNFYEDLNDRPNIEDYLRLVDTALVLLRHEQLQWRARRRPRSRRESS